MKQKVLVELDALLDTRRGVLFGLNPEAGKGTLVSEYNYRPSDDMSVFQKVVTQAEFEEAYKKRNKDTLKKSIVTSMHFFLNELVRKLEDNHRFNVDSAEEVEVMVNIHPYELDEAERETLAIAIQSRVGVITPVRIVSIPLEQMTIAFLNQEDYTGVILYNFHEWSEKVLANLEHHPENAPGITLFAPALFLSNQPLPKEEDLKDEKGNPADPFQMLMSFLAEVIGLSFLPIRFYCTPLPEEIKGHE